MAGIRVGLRGLRDTYEHLVYFTLMTLVWWVCQLLIVPGPAATVALFQYTDPRHGTLSDRPSAREVIRTIVRNLWSAWTLWLMTTPALALLLFNMAFYGETRLGVFSPFWFLLFLFGSAITLSAYAIYAIDRAPGAEIEGRSRRGALASLRLAAIVTGARLPIVIGVLLVSITVFVLGLTLAAVPLVAFVPATIAAIFNRFVMTSLRMEVPDPLAPTPERSIERDQERGKKRFGP